MVPSPGRIVHYMLTEQDAEQINRRRTTSPFIGHRMKQEPPQWPEGAQAHIGNPVFAGEVYPAMIVRVFQPSDVGTSNLQVFLDGCDVYWATSRDQVVTDSTDKKGLWFEPPRV